MSLGLAAVVLDGYHLDPGCGTALTARGLPVLALSDGGFGADQRATIHLDQNLGAVRPASITPDAVMLSGLQHVLLRDVVRSRRPDGPRPRGPKAADVTSVLAVFGGTDPSAAVLTLAPLLLSTGEPVHLRAIASTPATMQALARLETGPGQTLVVGPPADDLPALVQASDLVISAAGSSVWELLCLGAPTALVCVSDNQEAGYREVVDRGLVEGLGHIAALRDHEPTRRRCHGPAEDPGARHRRPRAAGRAGARRGRRPRSRAGRRRAVRGRRRPGRGVTTAAGDTAVTPARRGTGGAGLVGLLPAAVATAATGAALLTTQTPPWMSCGTRRTCCSVSRCPASSCTARCGGARRPCPSTSRSVRRRAWRWNWSPWAVLTAAHAQRFLWLWPAAVVLPFLVLPRARPLWARRPWEGGRDLVAAWLSTVAYLFVLLRVTVLHLAPAALPPRPNLYYQDLYWHLGARGRADP